MATYIRSYASGLRIDDYRRSMFASDRTYVTLVSDLMIGEMTTARGQWCIIRALYPRAVMYYGIGGPDTPDSVSVDVDVDVGYGVELVHSQPLLGEGLTHVHEFELEIENQFIPIYWLPLCFRRRCVCCSQMWRTRHRRIVIFTGSNLIDSKGCQSFK